MKILRLNSDITVILNDGTMLSDDKCTDEIYNDIIAHQNDENYVKKLLLPEITKSLEEYSFKKEILDGTFNSKYLTTVGNSVYIKSISELTLPEDLVTAFINAEKEENEDLIQTYLNFWTLCSLNPDSRARTNLFWFLNRYGMTISRSGLFIAYRNVVIKKEGSDISSELAKEIGEIYFKVKVKWKKSPKNFIVGYDKEGELKFTRDSSSLEEILGTLQEMYEKLSTEEFSTIYTDNHSGTFTIKIGEIVHMPREKCDSVQENTCSRGLHVAGRSWLSNNYFGNVSLMVLVNPADVVAVPPDDNYGKMRTCAYYPVKVVEFDEDGEIVEERIEDGFEDDFMNQISYTGDFSADDGLDYSLTVPDCPEIQSQIIIENLDRIKESLSKKIV